MRIFDVNYTDSAINDLIGIRRYIATNNPTAANKVGKNIKSSCESLSTNPYRGRPGSDPGTLELVSCKPYIIVYRVEEPNTVSILRIIHGAQRRRS